MASLYEKWTGKEAPFSKSRFRTEAETPAAELPEKYKIKVEELPTGTQLDVERYLHIFNNDITPVINFIDELFEGKSDYFENKKKVKEEAHPDDLIKFSDFEYLGKTSYDMMYRKDTENAKRGVKKIIEHPLMQPQVGIATGLWNTAAGIAELGAVLSDLTLDTDTLETVEKALPAIDMMDLYGDRKGSVAKFTSILTQFGTGFGLARKIATKTIGAVAKRKLAKNAATALAATKAGERTLKLAKFGGYWALPAALGDTMASTTASHTLGDIFGDPEAQGGLMSPTKRLLAHSKRESLEGLTGKERAAALLRNKLKFGAEGTAFFAGLTLVGPSLRTASTLAGATLKGLDKVIITPGSKLLSSEKTKIPQMFRAIGKAKKTLGSKAGIPKYELWKFSDWNAPFWNKIGSMTEATVSRFTSNFKFDPASANALRGMKNKIRQIKKNSDLWMKQLDRNMYGLVKAGFNDIAFNTRTATNAMAHWDEVLKALRGKIKIDDLPKSLRFPTRAIRDIIDKQTKELQPIIRDLDVREDMIKNIGKYLHTSYQIFKNNKWRASNEVYNKGVEYFANLLRQDPNFSKFKPKEILREARLKVARLMEIGRSDSMGTPAMRLSAIANNFADIKVPANIFKDMKNVPDEIAQLLGRVEDPKQIIMDTIIEQAHTIHSYNAYRDLAKAGLGKWLFRNGDEYRQFRNANNIEFARPLQEVKVAKPYNMDLEDIFTTVLKGPRGGTSKQPMLALPEMAKAIQDTSVMMDALLKLPFMKSLLAIKAGTQINKTVLSIMTQMRNITTASMFALANGHVGKGASLADNFDMLFKELIGKTKDPKKLRDMLDEALEAGALDSSTIATELEKMIPELMGPAAVPIKRGGKMHTVMQNKTSDQVMRYLLTNEGPFGRVVQKSIEAYQLGDNVWKLFGFNFTKSQLRPAFKNLNDVKKYFREVEGYEWNPLKAGSLEAGPHGRNLKTLNDAINEVSGLIVRDTYPNYSMVPRFVQNVRKFPIMGNFVGFTSEMWRNSYQMVRRGSREMSSSNPYIRQMGARRLVGFATTVATLGPMASAVASKLTNVGQDKIDAWKESFSPEYQLGHRIIPITEQDPETKEILGVDFDAQNPYTDVVKPFGVFNEVIGKGPMTDESMMKLWGRSFIDAITKAAEPFFSLSIWADTVKEMIPNDQGVSKTKSGGTIVDWNNEINPWEKAMYHLYSKLFPTTLKSGEKLWKAFYGQVTKHAMEYEPAEEVAATMAGVRVVHMNGYDGMKFAVNKRAGEMGLASKTFGSNAVNAQRLKEDAARIAEGLPAEHVPELFERWQQNRYRIWSETYKDIQNMRTLGYSEKKIKETITGRQPFSKDDIRFLMKGYYNPAKVPNLSYYDVTRFSNAIRTINRKDKTDLKMNDFFNRSQLRGIRNKWKYIPLKERDIDFDIPVDTRLQQYQEDADEWMKLNEEQIEEKEKQEQSFLPSTPIGTPNVDTQISTASRVSPTISGTVDQTTGLTGTESALLSPFEKEIAKRQNQGIGSLA